MKRPLIYTLLVMFLGLALASPALGQVTIYQRVPFASTPNPVGSGGRAVAWGGAFIAVADDATAASWNPGGLVQLVRPETSVVLSYHTRQEAQDFEGYDTDSESRFVDMGNLNYASAVYPFHVGEVNMVASINYQRLYEFDRDLEYTAVGTDATGFDFTETKRLEQMGALTTVTPAFCVQITPAWSLGLAVNFWGLDSAGDGWEQQWQVEGQAHNPVMAGSTVIGWSEMRETYEVSGTNYVIGTHVKVQNLTIGAVYKTSWEADVDYKREIAYSNYWPFDPMRNDFGSFEFDESEKIVWPESYGIGLAYRYSDQFSFAVDGYATRWSQYKLKTDAGDLNLLAGNDQTADIKDTWQVRAGAEYLWILPKYVLALRGGAFWDPEQVREEMSDFYGVALGGGMVYQNFVVDAALQYKWAYDVKGEKVEGVQASTDVQDFFGIVSLIYHF